MHQAREYPTYFTHGGPSPLNILVRGEHIVGIIDWEMAGWLPDYWEYTSAINVHPFWAFWRNEVGRFLRPYEEVEMEALRRQYFGDTYGTISFLPIRSYVDTFTLSTWTCPSKRCSVTFQVT